MEPFLFVSSAQTANQVGAAKLHQAVYFIRGSRENIPPEWRLWRSRTMSEHVGKLHNFLYKYSWLVYFFWESRKCSAQNRWVFTANKGVTTDVTHKRDLLWSSVLHWHFECRVVWPQNVQMDRWSDHHPGCKLRRPHHQGSTALFLCYTASFYFFCFEGFILCTAGAEA